jgi:hypothetical protein
MDLHILRDAASKAIDWKREAEEMTAALETAREDVVVSKATAADYLARSEKLVKLFKFSVLESFFLRLQNWCCFRLYIN